MYNIKQQVIYNTVASKNYIDDGLKQYFFKVYALMGVGLTITGAVAFAVFTIPTLTNIMFKISNEGQFLGLTTMGTFISFSPLGISLYFIFRFHSINSNNAMILFWIYAILMGMSLGALGFIYIETSIAKIFFICSSMFGIMSIYGYNTKKNLTSLGSFLHMGLIGIIIASIVNIICKSPAMEFALSFIGVLIFIGLIAYDTQKLKSLYLHHGIDSNNKMSIMAAFTLYLDFINLFIDLIRILGIKKEINE